MAFSKRFPIDKPGSPYARWEEIKLSREQEAATEERAREENNKLMRECVSDARTLFESMPESDVVKIAISLFEKRASHAVYWKEEEAKKILDEKERQE